MAKKIAEEVKNGLVENQTVETVEVAKPTQEAPLNEVPVQTATPGHGTRAFRA